MQSTILRHILDLARKIDADAGSYGFDRFAADDCVMDATAYRLLAIGEDVRALPPEVTAKYPGIPWRRIMGLRNLLAHNYDAREAEQVWETVTIRLPELVQVCRAELAAMGLPAPVPALPTLDILAEFRDAGALLDGHFILSSGLRSGTYLQCARVLTDPARAARLCAALAGLIPAKLRAEVTAVVAPAMGGLICGYELARQLGVESLFVERPQGVFELRRGFTLSPGQPVLMMEDVVTTGLSSREAITAIHAAGGRVVHAACLVDRSNGHADVGVPLTALLRLDVPAYAPDALPPELAALPVVKPGSRA